MSDDVERLDFGKPPRGYGPVVAKAFEDGVFYTCAAPTHPGWRGELRAEVLAAAWTHYKAHNDPPGLRTRPWGVGWVFCCSLLVERTPGPRSVMVNDNGEPYASEADARAAAWAWYERRLALADALEVLVNVLLERARAGLAGQRELQPADETAARLALEAALPSHVSMFDLWPRILTWTDEQVAEVERRIATLPEVLRA